MAILRTSMASIPKGIDGARVEAIHLKVGRLSSVVPESLRYCFEILRRDTPLSDAKLVIEEVPVVLRCPDCGWEKTIGENRFVCMECGSARVGLISGRELSIESLVLADPSPPAPPGR